MGDNLISSHENQGFYIEKFSNLAILYRIVNIYRSRNGMKLFWVIYKLDNLIGL